MAGRGAFEPQIVEAPGGRLDLGEIYRAHAEAVSRWARRLLGPEGEVQDVVHEVFLVAHRRLPDFRGDAKITTWLYAITVRVVQSHRRSRRWRRWLGVGGAEAGAAPRTPLEALESRQAQEVTYRILDSLPEAERTALILFELEGLSGDDIALVTGERAGTVWVRLHRARARFRKLFTAWQARVGDVERGGTS